jgi:hypothetical protein
MNPLPIVTSDDADLRLSLPAMQRAARRAREIARQTGTCVVVGELGQVKRIPPEVLDQIEAAWAVEIERRVAAYRAGELTVMYSFEEVFGPKPESDSQQP